jgi:lipopolysaccharide biosynthesis regulator YciM
MNDIDYKLNDDDDDDADEYYEDELLAGVSGFKNKKRKLYVCTKCGWTGHNSVTCKIPTPGTTVARSITLNQASM